MQSVTGSINRRFETLTFCEEKLRAGIINVVGNLIRKANTLYIRSISASILFCLADFFLPIFSAKFNWIGYLYGWDGVVYKAIGYLPIPYRTITVNENIVYHASPTQKERSKFCSSTENRNAFILIFLFRKRQQRPLNISENRNKQWNKSKCVLRKSQRFRMLPVRQSSVVCW